jgi:hypothetical protein
LIFPEKLSQTKELSMNKVIIMSFIVVVNFFYICVPAMAVNVDDLKNADNARANSDYAGEIDNWKFFKTNSNGSKLSYETRYTDLAYPFQHDSSMSQADITASPEIYIYSDKPGNVFLYIKTEPSEELRKEITEEIHKGDQYQKSWTENHKNAKPDQPWASVEFGFSVSWCRINCEKQVIEATEKYFYSNKNEFIFWFKSKGTDTAQTLEEFASNGIPLLKPAPFQTMCASFNKTWALYATLKRAKVEKVVQINELEVNPYEYEGRTIAVTVQFKKMLSKNSASFYSGYADLGNYTNVYDEIIVTGIPMGKHFESGTYAPRMLLVLKGKGTIAGTNAFGAKIKAPHFQWIDMISGDQPTVFEEQRDVSRKKALQNSRNAR